MGFDYCSENEQYLTPFVPGLGDCHYYGKVDYYGPTDHEESGIIVRGELDLEDETGKKVTLYQGEAFFIRRQSRIMFSAKRFALVFKCSSYAAGLGKSKELINK
ncbi:hypothetical protein Micbo1qcDRAFT_172539 [Microdochium bolleyi]|uniref:(S)-ureidoglycine aminohydrolase cupin domain-containing protein n=1 Tax=Microdochium bolleyi TaxID=196109 RepID=A0A136J8X4_9PEZI|nr:hypothetical protein Micbo1qcDRAFT_172539 [Microdochium bolleyi]